MILLFIGGLVVGALAGIFALGLISSGHCAECRAYYDRQNVKPCALQEFDRVMMQALAALQGADKVSAAIISIARDGRVDPGEDVKMGEILAYMKNVASTAEAMQLWIKKNLKGEVYNGKK